MDNHKLDNILKTAKLQSDRFFAGWDLKLNPEKVQEISQKKQRRSYLSSLPGSGKTKVPAAAVLIVVFLFAGLINYNSSLTVDNSIPVYGSDESGTVSIPHPIIHMLLAEDYLGPNGALTVNRGVLVTEDRAGLVTRIIPYQMDARGELVLSADRVLLEVGEELLLIGIDLPHQVELSTGEYYIKKVQERGLGYLSETRFSVRKPGTDWLRLTPVSDPAKRKSIFIQVTN